MINLSKSGDTIVFVFDNNGHYLQQGTIEVPMNSLSLITDNSEMATFKKAASNDIFVSALYSDFGMTKDQLISWYKENMVGGAGLPTEEIQQMIDESISSATSGYADSVIYNSTSHYVEFYHNGTGGTKVYEFDASDFIVDGMIDDVRIETIGGVSYLVIDFNTASGKQDIQIPLTDIFDPSNYYTKSEVDEALSAKTNQSDFNAYVTSADSRMLEDERVTAAALNALNTSLGDKADTSAVTESINAAVSGKVDTSTFETYSGNVETELGSKLDSSAYTPFNLPIYKGKGDNSLSLTQQSGATHQYYNNVSGFSTTAIGAGLEVTNSFETGIGVHNKNTSAVGNVFGQSGATLFSVGNGGGANNKHNAIEVKQNGDIYIANTNDTSYAEYYNKPMIKLQDALSGGSITVSSAITSGDTNAVAGGAVYDKFDEVETVTAAALNDLNTSLSGKADTSAVTESINAAVSGKVDTSTFETYSGNVETELGNKLDSSAYTPVTIDLSLDSGSTNPVANSAITNAINNKADKSTAARYLQVETKSNPAYENVYLSNQNGGVIGSYSSFKVGRINNKKIVGANNQFSLVETSAITTSVTSASTDAQVPSAKAVYDALQSGGGGEVSSAITSGDTNAVAGGAVYSKFDEVETVTAAALNDLNDKFGGLKIQKVTQAEYDALVSGGTVDNNTLYVVV